MRDILLDVVEKHNGYFVELNLKNIDEFVGSRIYELLKQDDLSYNEQTDKLEKKKDKLDKKIAELILEKYKI